MEVCGKRTVGVLDSCELCLIEGLSTQADGYCNECEEHMCHKCFQDHVKGKFCRNHVLSPLVQSAVHGEKEAGSNEKCKTHVRENVKYYCRKHDVVTCGDCNVADHQGCKMEFISNLAKQYENSSEFKDIERKIEKLEAEQKENKATLVNNCKENKACLDTALAEIKKFRKDINEHLDKVEEEIIFEANKLAKQNDDIIDEVEKMLSEAEQNIDDIRNTLDAKKIQGETLMIRTKEYTPKLSKAEECISLIRARNAINGFKFEQDKQLADMIKACVKIGCLSGDSANDKDPNVIQAKHVMTNVTADKQLEAKESYLVTEEASDVKQTNSQSIETLNPLLPVTEEKIVEGKHSYLPPDPRATGFDVGSRVTNLVPFFDERYGEWYRRRGTVKQVNPAGYVTVLWENGRELQVKAGANGIFHVELLNK